jgi:2-polyprenyl-6-hydroxyphenyl methylase/3-demethylubiquinone-9 3-methyltransferase
MKKSAVELGEESALANRNEVARGERFEFGKNWQKYSEGLTAERRAIARESLVAWLGADGLQGRRFLDIGCGSGLFSLSARELGASVTSFDFDPDSVSCTEGLRRQFRADDREWRILQGSVLDAGFVASLGTYDVVYSWGVLHHTGAMWQAIENACRAVAPGGKLWIAIYNDQGRFSRRWLRIKKLYCRTPRWLRWTILGPTTARLYGPAMVRDTLAGRGPLYTWREYKRLRGMSAWAGVVDWVGGYPFEVARPDEIFDFLKERGFSLVEMKTDGAGSGCNEFLARLDAPRRGV